MKHLLIVCASVACAIVAGGCSSGGGGTATMPFDPFGTEPVPATGPESTGGGNEAPGASTIAQLCVRACAHIQAVCPGSAGGPNCASDCASSAADIPGCTAQLRAFISCVATAPLTCSGGVIEAPACDGAALAVSTCAG